MKSSKGQQLQKMLDDLFSGDALSRDCPLCDTSILIKLLPEKDRSQFTDAEGKSLEIASDILHRIILNRIVGQLITGKKNNVSMGYYFLWHKYYYGEISGTFSISSMDELFTKCLKSSDTQRQFLENQLLPLAVQKSESKDKIGKNFNKMIEEGNSRDTRTYYQNYNKILEKLAEDLSKIFPDLFHSLDEKGALPTTETTKGKSENQKAELKTKDSEPGEEAAEQTESGKHDRVKKVEELEKKYLANHKNIIDHELELTKNLPRTFAFYHPTAGFIDRDLRISDGDKIIYEGGSKGFSIQYGGHSGVIVGERGSGKTSLIFSIINSFLSDPARGDTDHLFVYLTAKEVLDAKRGDISVDEFLVNTLTTGDLDNLDARENIRELLRILNDAKNITYFVDDLEKMSQEDLSAILGKMKYKVSVYYSASPENLQPILNLMPGKGNLALILQPLNDNAIETFIDHYCSSYEYSKEMNRKFVLSRISELRDFAASPIGVVACCAEVPTRYGSVWGIIRRIINTLLSRTGIEDIVWTAEYEKRSPCHVALIEIAQSMWNNLDAEIRSPSKPAVTEVKQILWQSTSLDEKKPENIPLKCSGLFIREGVHWGKQWYRCPNSDIFCFLVSQAINPLYSERRIPIRDITPPKLGEEIRDIDYLCGLQWEIGNESRLPQAVTLFSEKPLL